MEKAQTSVEFLMAMGVMIIMFMFLFTFTASQQNKIIETEDYLLTRSDCWEMANLISQVFKSGPGTMVETYSPGLITIYNNSMLGSKSAGNLSSSDVKVAVLASEAGETSQDFFDSLTASLNPSWYKVCFNSISGSGCQQWQPEGMSEASWDSINKTLDDLVMELDQYNVIYLEDASLKFDETYNGTTYIQIFENWVKQGNTMILSEHVMCREVSGGGESQKGNINCNPPGAFNNDVWNVFGHTLHQRGGSYGNDLTIIIEPDVTFFSGLNLNDTYDFEEDSYITKIENFTPSPGTNQVAVSGTYANLHGSNHNQGSFTETQLEDCPGSENDRDCTDAYAWEIGYDNGVKDAPVDFNATMVFNLSDTGITGNQITSLTVSWGGCWNGGTDKCDNGDNPEFDVDGNFEMLVYNGTSYERLACIGSNCEVDNTLLLGNYNTAPTWGDADAYNELSYNKSSGFTDEYLSNGLLSIRMHTWGENHGNNDDVWQEIDYVRVTIDYAGKPIVSQPNFTIVGTYDDNQRTGIAYWDYGLGRVFYFGDFQVEFDQNAFSDVVGNLIVRLYEIFFSPQGDEVLCSYLAPVASRGEFIGDIQLENLDGQIIVREVNST
jgi:hypothetical protein